MIRKPTVCATCKYSEYITPQGLFCNKIDQYVEGLDVKPCRVKKIWNTTNK